MSSDTPWTHAEHVLADARRRVARPGDGRRRLGNDDATPTPARPKLRLVGTDRDTPLGPPDAPHPLTASASPAVVDPLDPRWVLALRTADTLQGSILLPEHRDSLLRFSRVLGLTPFEANLTIAIVQDQARRGTRPDAVASAAEPQLRMIPLTRAAADRQASRWRVAFLVASGMAFELAALWWWLG